MFKRYKIILISLLFIVSCEEKKEYDDIEFEWKIHLPRTEKNFYVLHSSSNWFTSTTLKAHLFSEHANNREDYQRDLIGETMMVYWESSHYFLPNDSNIYMIKKGLEDDLKYIFNDPVSDTSGFKGWEAPCINFQSRPSKINDNSYQISSLFTPVSAMIGDTITVWAYFWDLNGDYIENHIHIIFENLDQTLY